MGAREIFEDAVRACTPELVNYVLRSGLPEEGARDTVQTALLKAWQAMHKGHEPENLRAWLYRITHNEMVSLIRREGTLKRIMRETRPAEPAREHPDLLEAVGELPEPYRQILLLRYCQGLRHDEVAEVLDIPAPTAKVYASRGLDKLREVMGILGKIE